jgi:hypothetical protein
MGGEGRPLGSMTGCGDWSGSPIFVDEGFQDDEGSLTRTFNVILFSPASQSGHCLSLVEAYLGRWQSKDKLATMQ